MKATKVYGNTIYINNEKIVLSKQAIKVLNYNSDIIDGRISFCIIESLEVIAKSKDDVDIINAAEKSIIVEIDKMMKGFRFTGFAVLSDNICLGLYLKRDNRQIFWGTEKANEVYSQLNK